MCGFVVLWQKNTGLPAPDMEEITSALAHRGPDDAGYFNDGAVSMGFRRLKIIDLDGGRQPMFNEDGNLSLVFNGEIYNYRELRKELLQKGHRLKSESDTEVILHLYEEEGEDCVNRLRGMFSFCLYDRRYNRLFGARDRFGIKPLYYLETPDFFALASEAKALWSLPAYRREVNVGAIPHYLTFQYVPEPQTMFSGIYKIPPAHNFSYNGSILKMSRYWRARFLPAPKTFGELLEETRAVMEESVKLHTQTDVPWGAFLSGGVDSSIIVALLREMGPVSTFSVGYEENGYSELNEAKETARYLETNHHEYLINPREFWEHLPSLVWHMDDPVADPSALSLYFVARLARENITVTLSGEGADEVFGGYGIYREPASLRPLTSLPSPLRFAVEAGAELMPDYLPGKNYIQRGSTPMRQRFMGNARIFKEHEKEELLKLKQNFPPTVVTDPLYDLAERLNYDEVATMQHIDLHTWMLGDILVKADKMTMANSLELRVPFLDHRVFEMAATIPTKYKISQNMTKYILRQAFKDLLPEKAVNRPKKGFPVPTRVWLRGPLSKQIEEVLTDPRLDRYFFRSHIEGMLKEHQKGRADHSRKLWVLVVFAVWLDQFMRGI